MCIVPFHVNEVTASLDLVKVYEYFARGKPVVCTPVAEMVQYGRYMYLADGAGQFLAQLDRALAEDDPTAVARRITLARLNSWDERLDAIEREILTGLADAPPAAAALRTRKPAPPAADVAALRRDLKATKARLGLFSFRGVPSGFRLRNRIDA